MGLYAKIVTTANLIIVPMVLALQEMDRDWLETTATIKTIAIVAHASVVRALMLRGGGPVFAYWIIIPRPLHPEEPACLDLKKIPININPENLQLQTRIHFQSMQLPNIMGGDYGEKI